jgi:hypothetical protein
MAFILENLADVAVRQARSERRIHAMQTIVKTGIKMLAGLTAAQKKTDAVVRGLAVSHEELAASHKRTEEALREVAVSQKKTDETVRQLAASQKRWFDRNSNGKA